MGNRPWGHPFSGDELDHPQVMDQPVDSHSRGQGARPTVRSIAAQSGEPSLAAASVRAAKQRAPLPGSPYPRGAGPQPATAMSLGLQTHDCWCDGTQRASQVRRRHRGTFPSGRCRSSQEHTADRPRCLGTSGAVLCPRSLGCPVPGGRPVRVASGGCRPRLADVTNGPPLEFDWCILSSEQVPCHDHERQAGSGV